VANHQEKLDRALTEQRELLFQAMGIVGLASDRARRCGSAIDGTVSQTAVVDIWTSLEAVYGLLNGVAGRLESSEVLLAEEVTHA
jgi:hypothetical protein